MKKFVSGLIAGITITLSVSVYAEEGLQKVEAFLRPSLPVLLNGTQVKLENPPLMYAGSTYLKLRDISQISGLQVYWNEQTQTVELNNPSDPKGEVVIETSYNQLKAIQVGGNTYFSYDDYADQNNKGDFKAIEMDSDRKAIYFFNKKGATIETVDMNNKQAVYRYNGVMYIHIKYIPEKRDLG